MSKEQEQSYHGNGHHEWEIVNEDVDINVKRGCQTMRLRVPGGWLYRNVVSVGMSEGRTQVNSTVVFVPMPAVVVHQV